MRSLLIALALLTAPAAWSQSTALQLSLPNNETELRVPKEPCDLARTVNWAHAVTFVPCDDLRFWFATTCGDEPPSGTDVIHTVPKANLPGTPTTGNTVTFEVSELPLFNEAACPAEDKEEEYKLCASVPVPGGLATDCSSGSKNFHKGSVDVVYDSLPPAVPTIDNVAELDKALSVRVGAPEGASQLKLQIVRADGTGARTLTQSVDQTLFRVEDLENGVTYSVTATAVDAADNESAPSEAQTGTPVVTRGFFDRYVEAGGQEMGGCGAAAGGLAGGWVLAILGFWLSSRRNRS
jgi:hypothetical protein